MQLEGINLAVPFRDRRASHAFLLFARVFLQIASKIHIFYSIIWSTLWCCGLDLLHSFFKLFLHIATAKADSTAGN